MLRAIWNLLFARPARLEEKLLATTKIRVHDVVFHVRKLNPIDHLRGARVQRAFFESFQKAPLEQRLDMLDDTNVARLKDHYRDVFMSCVVEPRLCYEKDKEKPGNEKAIVVDNLFTDWELANDLYVKLMELSYGKKKLTSSSSPSPA